MIWDVATGKKLVTFKGHGQWVNRAVFSPDDSLVATASDDMTYGVWSSATGRQLLIIETTNMTEANALEFSPDGKSIVISDGKTLVVYPLDLSILSLDPAEALEKAQQSAGMVLEGVELKFKDSP